ncbi:IclR family transcriptional regulator (plasmid) [Bartonella sp. HY329]|uniref:IclR family transcriptional regulator n=1 Tax=unclassified Bartonella TaxID=2645622 RepID=UPI0021C57FA8|nr:MULTISPECIES: IclR family transcriptional regulator [unclassified Bartonella]UXM96451.1 IclR family transcriptional regulator [Bartonella sp. HY329]UXN10774.1 IclR family transcriptional regulator [Bartonella sp. HY328]
MDDESFQLDEQNSGIAKRSNTIQSVSIATHFLNVLSNAESALALGEVAKRAATSGSKAHRYLQSLIKEGLAKQDPISGHYSLGPTALAIGISALKQVDGIEIAASHMKKLTDTAAMSGGVAIWTDRGPTLVRWYRSAYFSVSSLALGDVLPLDNTACGLVFQSYLSKEKIDQVRKVQPAHFRGKKPDDNLLQQIKKDRWMELSNHLLSGVTGQAAPVFDAQGEIICVMTTVADLGKIVDADKRRLLYHEAIDVNLQTNGY